MTVGHRIIRSGTVRPPAPPPSNKAPPPPPPHYDWDATPPPPDERGTSWTHRNFGKRDTGLKWLFVFGFAVSWVAIVAVMFQLVETCR